MRDTIVRGMLEEIDQNAADSQTLLWDLVPQVWTH